MTSQFPCHRFISSHPKRLESSLLWYINFWTKSVNSLKWSPRALPGLSQSHNPPCYGTFSPQSTWYAISLTPIVGLWHHTSYCTLMLSHTQTYRPKIITQVPGPLSKLIIFAGLRCLIFQGFFFSLITLSMTLRYVNSLPPKVVRCNVKRIWMKK